MSRYEIVRSHGVWVVMKGERPVYEAATRAACVKWVSLFTKR